MAFRLPAIMKTTAARLSALYFILFALCAVLLVFYMTSLSARMLTAQTMETINEEVQGLDRAYRRGGLPVLVRVIEQRSRQPGANLYLIADAERPHPDRQCRKPRAGRAGDRRLDRRAVLLPALRRGHASSAAAARRPDPKARPAASETRHNAIALVSRLPNQMIVLVGRDLGEPERFRAVVRRALMFALGMMAVRRAADLVFRRPPRAEAHRQRFRGQPPHHGRRSVRAACRSPAPATSSTGCRRTSTSC